MNVLKRMFRSLPAPLQHRLAPAAALLRRHEVTLLKGTEKTGGAALAIVVAGKPDLKDFVLRLAFAPGASEEPLGEALGWLGPGRIRARAPAADIVVWHIHRDLESLPRRGAMLRVPTWVRLQIDLDDRESIKRGKEKYNRIGNALRRAGFGFACGRTQRDFTEFYDRMHLPYVRSRHGNGATVETREEMLGELERGTRKLILVTRDGIRLGGGTMGPFESMGRFWHIGVRDADPALIAAGVADAVYHRVITLSRERGFRSLHLGHSRPFVRDGVFEYKRQFGAHAVGARVESEGSIEITPLRFTPAVVAFLSRNPVIAIETDGKYCFTGFLNGAPVSMNSASRGGANITALGEGST